MSSKEQQSTPEMLYNLLPEIYRMRDALQPGTPLQALLTAIAGQVDQFNADIGQLYDNWFIETCAPELLPYFADLVGLSLGPTQSGGAPRSPTRSPTAAARAPSRCSKTWRRRRRGGRR